MTDFEKIRKDYLELADNTSLTTDVLFEKLIINSFCKNMGYTPYLPTEINRNKIQLHFPNATTLYIRFVDESKISITNIQNFTKMLHTIANSSEMYGILTNGREFLLLNSRFYNTSSVILRFDLLSKKAPNRQKYFSYLSKRALVDNKSTDNFKMITEFKISYNNGKTYPQYISTLEAFFYSYANPSCTTQRSYKNVSTQDISKFLDEKQHAIDLHSGRKINKKTSLNNSYSHISSFYKFLFEQGEITEIPIETKRKAALNHYPNMPLNRHTADIKPTDIESMINTLRNSRNPQRNITIFSLCAYLGISRNDIYNLNWNCVFEYDAEYPHIVIEGREIPLCNLLIKNFSYLRNKRNINTHTLEDIPVFVSGKSNSNRLSESAINDIFDIFKKNSTEENDKWAKMCPQLLRFSLIEKLFHCKFSLEDIIYITGIDISNIGNYIPYAEIITNYNPYEQKNSYLLSEKLKKDHPYAYIFK